MTVHPEARAALEAVEAGARAADVENDRLEFKTEGRSLPDTLEAMAAAAACLANSAGGLVVIGVADRRSGSGALVGCALDALRTKRRIFELTEPHLTVDVDEIRWSAHRLLVITVPSSADVHAVGGRVSERIGAACQPMSTSRIATVVAERRGDDWSSEDSGRSRGDVDPLALPAARRMLQTSGDPTRRGYATRQDADLLRMLGLVTTQGTLTRGGALMLCRQPEGGEQLAYLYRRTPAGALAVNERLEAPLLPALQRIFELIDARSDRTSVNLPGGQQLQLADLPENAVREAVINAVMHRDHRRPSAVQVEHTATRLVVSSPGAFVSGVTVDNVLTTTSRSRNPSLASAIRALGLAETAGAGVDRMYVEMARLGHRPPSFAADDEQVRVTLLGGAPNAFVARFVATLPSGEAEDADTMLVLLTLQTRRTITPAALAPALQKPDDEVRAVLVRLASDRVSLVERTRESAHRATPVYRLREHVVAALGPALAYHRRTTDEYDRKVIGLLREAGEVNARMVKLLLDLDTVRASRVLGDLVDRGVLAKTSRAQRGPSVTYGPGPAFPPASRRGRKAVATEGEA